MKLCESIDKLGVDGTSAAAIASALGYSNIKTNTFSARLSAARQFGLIALKDDRYTLTTLARAMVHPVDVAALPRLRRQALVNPPLYADLAARLEGKRVPEAPVLANILYHNHRITANAKQAAAEAFLESARFAGAISDEQVFHPEGVPAPVSATAPHTPTPAPPPAHRPAPASVTPPTPARGKSSEVRIDLRLWDADEGKTIRVRAPRTITPASFERMMQAFRLMVRIAEPEEGG